MYKKILVPLDGSNLSECSLDHAKAIASCSSAPEVILLRAVEPMSFMDIATIAQSDSDAFTKSMAIIGKQAMDEAKSYLTKVEGKLNKGGLKTKIVAVSGNPAETILDYASKNKVDMIIMSTHGRSGVSRWAFGSVTDKIVSHADVPVLTISPKGCRKL
jgi:nucleotide-binding universal stress UspA family protein